METGKLDGTWQVDKKIMILKQERTVKGQVELQLFTRIFKNLGITFPF